MIALGALSAVKPLWLEEWADLGVTAESEAYKRYGDSFLRRGEYAMAASQYLRALEIDPDRSTVMVNLAVAYRELGRTNEAAKLLKNALKITGGASGVVSYNIGELMAAADKPEAALPYFEKAVGSSVEQDLVYRQLGSIHLEAGRYPEALEAFEQMLACQMDVGLSYRRMLLRAKEAFENDSVNLAIVTAQLEAPIDDALLAPYDLTTIHQLRERDPELAKTHNHLGYLQYQLGDLAAAQDHFARSLAIWPANTDAANGLAALSQARATNRVEKRE